MTTTIKSSSDGTYGALQVNGDDAVTFDATGIQAGSYKAGSINSNDFADGALIENAPVGIGYGPGAGGTVTQATSKSTTVTLNKPTGTITTAADALAAGASVTFRVNNSLVEAPDSLSVAGNNSGYTVVLTYAAVGYFGVRITNITAGVLSEAIGVKFGLLKGATS